MWHKSLICVFGLLLGLFRVSYGQYENVWVWNGRNINGLNFNSGDPVPFKSNITGLEAHAMVCDAKGQLLFYTNGEKVWNHNHQIMPNGNDLLELPDLPRPVHSTHQGTIIVPMPNHTQRYYVFSLISLTGGGGTYAGRLYYSIVDMSLDNNLGDIDLGNKGVYLADGFVEGMTAVVGDRCNIWLLVWSSEDGNLKAFEISGNGIQSTAVTSPVTPAVGAIATSIKASADRTKILLTSNNYYLLDFDPLTGKASNLRTLLQRNFFSMEYLVPEFSPDNTKVYAPNPIIRGALAATDSLCQYDITLNAIDMYNQRIAITDSVKELKIGPDGRIYLSRGGNIDRINYPNLTGSACGHEENVFPNMELGYGGGPNIVPVITHDTFRSSELISSVCFADTNSSTIHAVNDSTGWNYVWNTGLTQTTLTPGTPGTYWITYRSPPCNYHTDTFHVSFPDGVLPDITVDTACENDNNGGAYAATYPGDTVTYHYTWKNAAGAILSTTDTLSQVLAGNYTLHVATANCDTSLSFYIPEMDYRVAFLADSLICMQSEMIFDNTSDDHFYQFLWDFGDQHNSLLRDPAHSYARPGDFYVQLTGIGDICTDSAVRLVTVDPRFSGSFAMQPDSICQGETILFQAGMSGNTIRRLDWEFGDGAVFPAVETVQHAYEHAGVFPVRLTSRFRVCPNTSFIDTIHVDALPKVDLGSDQTLCLNGAPVLLRNGAAEDDVHSWFWNTGDTTKTLEVRQPGVYALTVSTVSLGCSSTAFVEIFRDCYIDIPNAFTPNGDGENDYFFPRQLLSKSVSTFRMRIFNRWGQVLYETHRIDGRGWDGRFNGLEQPSGVYIYDIEVEIKGLDIERYQGNVTLIR